MAGYVASRIGRLNANVAAYNYELKEDFNGLALFFHLELRDVAYRDYWRQRPLAILMAQAIDVKSPPFALPRTRSRYRKVHMIYAPWANTVAVIAWRA